MTPQESKIAESTTKTEHRKEVETIIERLRQDGGKTVAARAIRIDSPVDIDSTFAGLCEAYPDAFVFAFSTTDTGTWMGASPELLLKKEGRKLSTMALAGTRPAGTTDDWDLKNREEQQMVAEYIKECLSDYCTDIKEKKTFTKNAGAVEHICTVITATLPDIPAVDGESHERDRLKNVLCTLSPTPALCGTDRDASMHLIKELESFDREMYGGFCGPYDIGDTTEFYVNLRSAKCGDSATCVFAGGGITHLSDPDDEWNETEIKSKTIINKLKLSEV